MKDAEGRISDMAPARDRRFASARSVEQVVTSHVSVRSFTGEPLAEDMGDVLVEAMVRAPTSSALQAYTMVLVDDREVLSALRPHAGGQAFVASCAVMIIGCVDVRRYRTLTAPLGYAYRADDARSWTAAVEDISISFQNASLVAQSRGYGTVMVGGVLDGTLEIARVLHLPLRVAPVLGLCIGVPTDDPANVPVRPRIPNALTFHRNRFDMTREEEDAVLDAHDAHAAEHDFYASRRIPYAALGLDDDDHVPDERYGWREHVARKQSRTWWDDSRGRLNASLAAMGFEID